MRSPDLSGFQTRWIIFSFVLLYYPKTCLKLTVFLNVMGRCAMLIGCLYLVLADFWGLWLVSPHWANLWSCHIQFYHCGAQLPCGALQKASEEGSYTGRPERTHAWRGKVWNNHLLFSFNKFYKLASAWCLHSWRLWFCQMLQKGFWPQYSGIIRNALTLSSQTLFGCMYMLSRWPIYWKTKWQITFKEATITQWKRE